MKTFRRHLRRWGILTAICLMTFANSGCTLTSGFIGLVYEYAMFWETLPVMPVTPYQMGRLEDAMWENERYKRVPVLDPIEGENAPIFCVDPPGDDQIIQQHLRAEEELNCFTQTIPLAPHLQKAALFSQEPRMYITKYAGDIGANLRSLTDEFQARLLGNKPPALVPPPLQQVG